MKSKIFRKNNYCRQFKLTAIGILLLLFCPVALSAQDGGNNGVTVSNLVVEPGTVTFSVSWQQPMPVEPWSDTVWVFVEYNDAGVMKRLPVTDATASAGSVVKVPGNTSGVWVVGDAQTSGAGSFSATVQLFTSGTAIVSGACAYASNYPPVGEYTDASQIKFTGTSMYKIVLEEIVGAGTLTDYSDGLYTVRPGYTILSFTDATGAPGRFKCLVPATYTLQASASSFCAGAGVTFSLSDTESGVRYQLYDGVTPVGSALSGTGSAATFSGVFSEGAYTARTVADEKYCTVAMTGTHTIAAYPAFTAGAITTASATTTVGTNPNVTVQSASPASGGGGNITYLWLRTGTSAATLTANGAATYTISSGDYSAAGTHYFNRYAKDATCNTAWAASSGTYTLGVKITGVNQQQGQCTFTQPDVVGTFANFPSTYSASTYVTLTDERDSKNYTVVKIGGRWIMGQNLNYQEGLTYFKTRGTPNGNTGSNAALRGGFWCPSNSSGEVDVVVCDYWGAQYAWETAMMLDGKGTWTETSMSGYCTGAANTAACKQNFGRAASAGTVTGGRGICPPNWHVPTDNEWGLVLDAMESTTSTAHSTASGSGWYGTNAGTRGKARCSTNSSDTNPTWSSGAGTDDYNFRIVPTDDRNGNGSSDSHRGSASILWSSSANSASDAWYRAYTSDNANVYRASATRSLGTSIRCIRDL